MNTPTKTGINAAKKIGDKYGKNLMDTAKKQGTNFPKTASKKNSSKNAKATVDLIGNKIAVKITSLGNKPKNDNKENETNEAEEITIPPEKRQQIINDLRLF